MNQLELNSLKEFRTNFRETILAAQRLSMLNADQVMGIFNEHFEKIFGDALRPNRPD